MRLPQVILIEGEDGKMTYCTCGSGGKGCRICNPKFWVQWMFASGEKKWILTSEARVLQEEWKQKEREKMVNNQLLAEDIPDIPETPPIPDRIINSDSPAVIHLGCFCGCFDFHIRKPKKHYEIVCAKCKCTRGIISPGVCVDEYAVDIPFG